MAPAALDHLLRTMAAVQPGRRVLVRGTRYHDPARALAQLGFEVHAAPWTEAAARRVQHDAGEDDAGEDDAGEDDSGRAVSRVEESPERSSASGSMYATAAPLGALPYPEEHFDWGVVLAPSLQEAGDRAGEALEGLLREARHHLRSGGWVFVVVAGRANSGADAAAGTPAWLGEVARRANLAEAEVPEREAQHLRAIYRRVDERTAR